MVKDDIFKYDTLIPTIETVEIHQQRLKKRHDDTIYRIQVGALIQFLLGVLCLAAVIFYWIQNDIFFVIFNFIMCIINWYGCYINMHFQ